jgi:hypothetical protein
LLPIFVLFFSFQQFVSVAKALLPSKTGGRHKKVPPGIADSVGHRDSVQFFWTKPAAHQSYRG